MRPVCNQYNKLWLLCAIFFYATEKQEQQQQLLQYYYIYPSPHHAGICAKQKYDSNLDCRWRCLVRITSQTLYPFESTPVSINHETVWTPDPRWKLQRRKNIQNLPGFELQTIQPRALSKIHLHYTGSILQVNKNITNH